MTGTLDKSAKLVTSICDINCSTYVQKVVNVYDDL